MKVLKRSRRRKEGVYKHRQRRKERQSRLFYGAVPLFRSLERYYGVLYGFLSQITYFFHICKDHPTFLISKYLYVYLQIGTLCQSLMISPATIFASLFSKPNCKEKAARYYIDLKLCIKSEEVFCLLDITLI